MNKQERYESSVGLLLFFLSIDFIILLAIIIGFWI